MFFLSTTSNFLASISCLPCLCACSTKRLQTCQGINFTMSMSKMNWLWKTCLINKRPLIVGKYKSLLNGNAVRRCLMQMWRSKKINKNNADAQRTRLFSSVSSVDSDHKNAEPFKSWVLTGQQYPNLGKISDCMTFIASYRT